MGRTSRRIPSGFLPPGTPRGGLVRSSSYAVSTVPQPLRATGRPWYAQPSMNQADLTALLKRLAPTDWPRIWSAIYAHREACIAEVLECRRGLRRFPGSGRPPIDLGRQPARSAFLAPRWTRRARTSHSSRSSREPNPRAASFRKSHVSRAGQPCRRTSYTGQQKVRPAHEPYIDTPVSRLAAHFRVIAHRSQDVRNELLKVARGKC